LGEKKRRHTARLEPESVDTVVLMRSCEAERSGLACALRKLCQKGSGGTGRVRSRHRITRWRPSNQALAAAPQTERARLGDWLACDELRLAILRDWRRMHIRGAGMLC